LSTEDYTNDPLWPTLTETVHAMVMYPHHKAYVKRVLLKEKPDITPRELAITLGIPLGEATVILHELRSTETKANPEKG